MASGKYRLGRLIGGGGMAEVFEATAHGAEGFARPVAIKRMLPALSLDPAFGQMFVNEARIASLLHHENIVSVLDFDRDAEGRYFLVMELVSGVDLRKLASSGPLPWSVVAFLLAEVLDGLGYAHELETGGRALRIVHRDVSPHNVMISWDGAVKVVDFGIAKALAATGASRSNTLKGKMAYMSPEQAHGLELDGRADVFAVGVMGHELLTGQKLFAGQTEAEVLARLLTQPIGWPRTWRPDVPADLEAVVMQMLERDRGARFANAQAAQEALLSTSVIDPRAQIALRELMRQRFPEAPRRRGESQPNFVATPSGPLPLELTTPSGEARDVMSADTRTAQRTPVPAAGRSRAALWIALAVVTAVAIVAVTVMVTRGGGGATAAKTIDAAPIASAAVIDAMPAAQVEPPDAAQIAIAPIVIDAGAPAPIDRHHHHPDAGGASAVAIAHAAPPDAPPPPPDAAPAAIATAPAPPDAAPRPGTLHVTVNPWAHIYVDGVLSGDTPFKQEYPAGEHTVRVVNDGIPKEETITVTIQPGRQAEVHRNWSE